MTTEEAYELAIEKVNELKESGIDTEIIPSCQQNDLNSHTSICTSTLN